MPHASENNRFLENCVGILKILNFFICIKSLATKCVHAGIYNKCCYYIETFLYWMNSRFQLGCNFYFSATE